MMAILNESSKQEIPSEDGNQLGFVTTHRS